MTLINSQYKILDTLTDLNYEKVYLCENTQQEDQLCIVKKYLVNNSNEKVIDNFVTSREKINQNVNDNQLRFPLVINLIKNQNEIMLVENIIQGISLKQLINNDNLWSESEAIKNLQYLLESLTIMHNNNFIHNNINPENILRLLSTNNSLLITNLDVAMWDEVNLMATIAVEDKLYIAPEKIRGKSIIANDIYSLGMVIITMLIGKKINTLTTNKNEQLIWETEINLGDNFTNLLNKMIAIELNDRYQNSEEVLEDLNKIIQINNLNQYPPTEIIIGDNEEKYQTNSSNNQSFLLDEKQEKMSALISEIDSHQIKDKTTIEQENNENKLSENSSKIYCIRDIKIYKSAIKIAFMVVFIIIFGSLLNIYLYNRKVKNIINDLDNFYREKNYNDCIALLNSDNVTSLSMGDEITTKFFGKCWLGLAEIEVSNQNYEQAIEIATKIPNDSPDYQNASQLIDDCSGKIIEQATGIYYNEGNMPLALAKLDKIPESSSKKKEALNLRQQWIKGGDGGINLCPGLLCPDE